KLHALRGRQEGDEEMMLPGQAMLGGVGQDAAQHTAQRVARQHVVSDMIGRHWSVPSRSDATGGSAAMSVARFAHLPMLPRLRAEVSRLAADGGNSGKRASLGPNRSGGF